MVAPLKLRWPAGRRRAITGWTLVILQRAAARLGVTDRALQMRRAARRLNGDAKSAARLH